LISDLTNLNWFFWTSTTAPTAISHDVCDLPAPWALDFIACAKHCLKAFATNAMVAFVKINSPHIKPHATVADATHLVVSLSFHAVFVLCCWFMLISGLKRHDKE